MSHPEGSDRRVATVIESGVIFGAADRLMERAWRGASHSVVVAAAGRIGAFWTGLAKPAQRLALGLMLIVAVATHLVFTVVTEVPGGWQWLILPALCAAAGGVIVMTALVPAAEK